MGMKEDLAQIALQEKRLQFERFNESTAWELGGRLKAAAEARQVAIAIDIRLKGFPLFFYAMPGTSPDNADWMRRKRNVVERFHCSSYAMMLDLTLRETSFGARYGVSDADFVAAGGGFPIIVRGTGCVGSICVSGLPGRSDHGLVVEVVAGMLGVSAEDLALNPA